ncbi:MAG TPA: hypothetical protein VNF02_05080 [Candidatus Limnocylindrales bacterium]|nr:hypothetical protein [Candidatus Limnocylindrales bacterium]
MAQDQVDNAQDGKAIVGALAKTMSNEDRSLNGSTPGELEKDKTGLANAVVSFRGVPVMKKISLVISLWACFGASVHAQQKMPALLFRAAHCLAVKDFLPPSNAGKLTFGYFLDEHSYSGDKVIYIAIYSAPARSNGWFFAVFPTGNAGHEVFNIQSNATFVLSKHERVGVSFTSPPLGGIWTQEHIVSAIKKIERQPRFTILVKDLYAPSSCSCESYTDPQPKEP